MSPSTILMAVVIGVLSGLIVATGGCAMMNPGIPVQTGLTESDHMLLGGKSGLDATFDGTHGVSFMYARGQIKTTFDADGNIIPDIENSTLTEMIWKKGNPEKAADSMDSMAKLGAAQSRMMTTLLESVVQIVGTRTAPVKDSLTTDAPPAWAVDIVDRLDALEAIATEPEQ